MSRALAVLVFCFSACARPEARPVACVQPVRRVVTDLSAELEAVRVKQKLPALAAAVWRGNDLLAIGASGFRKTGSDERVTVDDRWHLGSDTKAMTAVLVAIWIDRGKLKWDDTLGAIFGAKVSPGFAGVTIEQLLGHRGGFEGDMPNAITAKMWQEYADPNARAHAVDALLARAPARAPGTFEYANASYLVLGGALERVTGKTWEDLMRADLFAPLGMPSCGFGAPSEGPWGHRRDGDGFLSMAPGPLGDNAPALGPAGTVHCSLRDWGKFLAVVLAGARGEKTIASAATMKRLLTPPPGGDDGSRYAGGWAFTSIAGKTALTHTGSNSLWTATAWLLPEKNLAFAAVTNVFDPKALDASFEVTIPRYAR